MNIYERPMLATASTGASNRAPIDPEILLATGHWVLDTKLDGVRAFWRDGRLINRRGVDITHQFPEVVAVLQLLPPSANWLDGELVSHDSLFETVASRAKQEKTVAIARGAEQHPCMFIAFDLPSWATRPWRTRRDALEALANGKRGKGLTLSPVSYDVGFLDQVKALGMEGVIAKRIESRYAFSKRSPDWVKFKFTQRISCLVQGYEPGKGSRAHLGAIHLALFDHEASKVVPVGRCGSGFTEKATHDLKARIDAGEILVAEIEALNLTSGGTLRFPVYRGLRTDVAPLECTVDQLAVLPRSGKAE